MTTKTFPELNAGNPPKGFPGELTLTVRGGPDLSLAYLATAFVAATDPRDFVDSSVRAVRVREPRTFGGASDELYSFDALPDLDALAEAQGVTPVTRFEDLLGDSWPEGESVDDFIAAAREGRHEQESSAP